MEELNQQTKSKLQLFIDAVQAVIDSSEATNQYRVIAQLLDTVNGTSELAKMGVKPSTCLKAIQKMGYKTLMEYAKGKALMEIPAVACTIGDVLIIPDTQHDDIAICLGTSFVLIDDADDVSSVHTLNIVDFTEDVKAYRIA